MSGLNYSLTMPSVTTGGAAPLIDYNLLSSYGASGGGLRAPTGQIASLSQTGLGTPGVGGGSIWDSFLSTPDKQGWGGTALGVANSAMNAWMGLKQYGLAKSQLAEGKRQFGLNYDAQRRTTNAQLEDRQRARVTSNAGAYQSVGDYMSKNGIPGG